MFHNFLSRIKDEFREFVKDLATPEPLLTEAELRANFPHKEGCNCYPGEDQESQVGYHLLDWNEENPIKMVSNLEKFTLVNGTGGTWFQLTWIDYYLRCRFCGVSKKYKSD